MFRRPLRLTLSGFERQHLAITTPWLRRPTLLLNGHVVPLWWGKGEVLDDSHQTLPVRVRRRLPDPLPSIKVGEVEVRFGEAWRWYERLWVGLPLVLILGGAAGTVLALLALLINGQIFRSRYSATFRYLATLLVLTAAIAGWADVWWWIRTLAHAHPR